jgi:Trk K+ transport system NAD-binding subunit
MGLITLVGVVTIFVSTYMILYSGQLYSLLSKPLKIFEKKNPYRESVIDTFNSTQSIDVILVGLGNYGSGLAENLLKRNKSVIGVDFDPEALEKWRAQGLSVLYGDMADPEIHEQLPLKKARWVVSTARIKELNLAMLNQLKKRGFQGKIALTAINQEEAHLFKKAGADVVFRPFNDAAEQAVDSLSQAMDMLPAEVDWPISFMEIRVQSGSAFAGQTIRNIPIRSLTGVSILAVSRAGRINYDLDPDYQIYPGDHLIIMGPPSELKHAESLFNQMQENPKTDYAERIILQEITINENSIFVNKTIANTGLRQQFGATIVGIRRGDQRIKSPGPAERIINGDSLIVIGSAMAIQNLKESQNSYQ